MGDEERQHGGCTLLKQAPGRTRFATTRYSTEEAQQHQAETNNSRLLDQRKTLRRNITYRARHGSGSNWELGLGSKVPSMLFDIEMESEKDTEGNEGSRDSVLDLQTAETIYKCLLPNTEAESKLIEDVEQAAQDCEFTDSPADDTRQLALRLGQVYPAVRVRTALGGGEGRSCLRNLRHTFLTLQLAGRSFIIDLAFKEQFIIAKPTERYAVLLDCLPRVHVAEEHAVEPLVRFLCREMALAFQQQATQLPPWRYADSMMSKWRPRRSLDKPADALETPSSSSGPSSTEHLPGPDVSHLIAQQQLLQQQLQQEDAPAAGLGYQAQACALDHREVQARALDHQAQARAHSELPVGLLEGMQGVHHAQPAVRDDLDDLGASPSPPDLVEGMRGLQTGPHVFFSQHFYNDGDNTVGTDFQSSRWQAGGDRGILSQQQQQQQSRSHLAAWPPANMAAQQQQQQQQQQCAQPHSLLPADVVMQQLQQRMQHQARPPANAPGSTSSRSNPVNCEPQMVIVGGDFSSL